MMEVTKAALFILMWFIASCEENNPGPKFLGLGSTFIVKPVSVDGILLAPPLSAKERTALQLSFMWGSKPLNLEDDDFKVEFFKTGQETVWKSFKWSFLQEAYKQTDCPDKIVKKVSATGPGFSLICNDLITPADIGKIAATNSKGEVRKATSWSYFQSDEGVNTLAASLFK